MSALAYTAETYWKEGAPDLVVPGRAPLGAVEQQAVFAQAVGAWYATLVANQFWCVAA